MFKLNKEKGPIKEEEDKINLLDLYDEVKEGERKTYKSKTP
jgi:hypothetical protein